MAGSVVLSWRPPPLQHFHKGCHDCSAEAITTATMTPTRIHVPMLISEASSAETSTTGSAAFGRTDAGGTKGTIPSIPCSVSTVAKPNMPIHPLKVNRASLSARHAGATPSRRLFHQCQHVLESRVFARTQPFKSHHFGSDQLSACTGQAVVGGVPVAFGA